MMELFKYVRIKRADIGDPHDNITLKAMAKCVDGIESAIAQACIDCAKDEGFTDLYLLDRKFVIDALKEKVERFSMIYNTADDRLILGDELLRIREKISCPQLGDDHYGEWGALRADQRVTIERLLYTVAYLDELLEKTLRGGEG